MHSGMHRARVLQAVAYLVAVPFICSPLHGDPMGAVEGGGTVRLLAEHPAVSLDDERLIFEPLGTTTRVSARLEMANHGEAATVPMGFPVPLWHPGSGQDFVKDFTVAVDGTGLAVTEDRQVRLVLAGSTPTCRWYRFAVPFEAQQKRQMTVTYDLCGPGSPQVCYILATGGTWKDTLRSFELEVKLGERLDFHGLSLTGDRQPLPYEQHAGSLIWRCRDYNGQPEVLWFSARHGPASVLLDGELIGDVGAQHTRLKVVTTILINYKRLISNYSAWFLRLRPPAVRCPCGLASSFYAGVRR